MARRYWYNVKHLPRVTKIIAVSNCTKNSLVKHFNYPEKNIHVVYNGVSEEFKVLDNREELRTKYAIKTRTVLHVGTSFPRKNLEIILKVISRKENLILIKVGGFTKKQIDFMKNTK